MDYIDRLAVSGKRGRIVCRSSYDRRKYHQYAESKGLSHRSIIDYTKIIINERIEETSYNTYMHIVSGIPSSMVEINNGYEKEIIGDPDSIHYPISEVCNIHSSEVFRRLRRRFRRLCAVRQI